MAACTGPLSYCALFHIFWLIIDGWWLILKRSWKIVNDWTWTVLWSTYNLLYFSFILHSYAFVWSSALSNDIGQALGFVELWYLGVSTSSKQNPPVCFIFQVYAPHVDFGLRITCFTAMVEIWFSFIVLIVSSCSCSSCKGSSRLSFVLWLSTWGSS